MILYEGPSQLDGEPILCIATENTSNKKTGPMVQTWILVRDTEPDLSVQTGQDSSICGSCPLRGIIETLPSGEPANRYRACYVFVAQSPQRIWLAYRAGKYKPAVGYDWLRGKLLRIGAYGDPCAVPLEIWEQAAKHAAGRTGYTHQWQDPRFQAYRDLLMASVETVEQAHQARSMGWRTFRVAATGERPERGEFHCPASDEQGYRLTCSECRACDGAAGKPQRASVIIWPHGPPAAMKSYAAMRKQELKPLAYRAEPNKKDRELLAILALRGPLSVSQLKKLTSESTQAVATRLWHLRQAGFVRRIGEGRYEIVVERVL